MKLTKHSFHIPVMGLCYTADSPSKVAHFGISSVISIVDDFMIEKMRKLYSEKFELPFQEISNKVEDFRAKRITAYLDLVDKVVNINFDDMVNNFQQKRGELEKYFDMLPNAKSVRESFAAFCEKASIEEVKEWLHNNLAKGDIDVNIMTKLDKANMQAGVDLPENFNDAQAGLRGFANSTLNSSVILSAGMNPRLYSYVEEFEDFYPNADSTFNKKITLKVSDYRSALVQGKMLAKKGIWVSEYRIESGLNCGGHAFATQGVLLGPILQEFSDKREELLQDVFDVLQKGLEEKGKAQLAQKPAMKITAQGGVGTHEEHNFLIKHYNLDAIGWGSPFMLVPEATTVDDDTMELLRSSKEKDFYMSNASPLGVLFNNVKNSGQQELLSRMHADGKHGFPCTKKYLVFNTEYTDKPICTASRQYQSKKIAEIEASAELSAQQKELQLAQLAEKECLCEGLSNSAYKLYDLPKDGTKTDVSVCPGPNVAFFDKVSTLPEMVAHIYGKSNVLSAENRPNLFIKELKMYVDYLEEKVRTTKINEDTKQAGYFKKYMKNLDKGLDYYRELFSAELDYMNDMQKGAIEQLEALSTKAHDLVAQ